MRYYLSEILAPDAAHDDYRPAVADAEPRVSFAAADIPVDPLTGIPTVTHVLCAVESADYRAVERDPRNTRELGAVTPRLGVSARAR